MMFSRVLILDPVLKNRVGHHHETTRLLADTFRREVGSVLVFGHRTLPDDIRTQLGAEPLFRTGIYARSDKPAWYGVPHDWAHNNEVCEQDLGYLDDLALGHDDLIVFHTTWSSQMLGIHKWYRALPNPKPRICLFLHFPPDLDVPASESDVAMALQKRALAPWLSEPRDQALVAVAASPELAALLSELAGANVPTFPLVIPTDDLPLPNPSAISSRPVFLYLGGPRREKGFWELIDAIGSRPLAFHFLLHVQRPEIVSEVAARTRPNDTEFVLGELTRSDYVGLLGRAEGVLLPYDPKDYCLRTSGIFVEAICAGLPVLTTAGTWMHRELVRIGEPGLAVSDRAPSALADAIESFAGKLADKQAIARRVAMPYRHEFSAAGLVQAINQHFGSSTEPLSKASAGPDPTACPPRKPSRSLSG